MTSSIGAPCHRLWHLAHSLVALLAIACGSTGDSPGVSAASSCERQVDQYLERVAECFQVTAEQRQAAIDQCTSGALPPGAMFVQWRPEFNAEVDSCADTLSCEQFDDVDDICFPQALAVLARDVLSAATIDACISGATDDCSAHLQAQSTDESHVVGACFNRWNDCIPELPNSEPYWTEDQCGMILALTDARQSDARSCIDLACTEVAACLRDLGALNF